MKKRIISVVFLAMLPLNGASPTDQAVFNQELFNTTIAEKMRPGGSFEVRVERLENLIATAEFKDAFLIAVLEELQRRALKKEKRLTEDFVESVLSRGYIINDDAFKAAVLPFVIEGQDWSLWRTLINHLKKRLLALHAEEGMNNAVRALALSFAEYLPNAVAQEEVFGMMKDDLARLMVGEANILAAAETAAFKDFLAMQSESTRDAIGLYLDYLRAAAK